MKFKRWQLIGCSIILLSLCTLTLVFLLFSVFSIQRALDPILTEFFYQEQLKELENLVVHSPRKIVKKNANLQELWSLTDLPVGLSSLETKIATGDGIIYILGQNPSNGLPIIVARDTLNGNNILWTHDGRIWGGGDPSLLDATSKALYVGRSGRAIVTAYVPKIGDQIWETRLPSGRTVSHLNVIDNIVNTPSSSKTALNADTGEVLKFSQIAGNGQEYFIDTEFTKDIKFREGDGLRAIEL